MLPEELTGLRYHWTSTSGVHEAQDDFTGPTAHPELGTPWAGETWFKLHPSQTRGHYDGTEQRDYSPSEPSGTAIEPRPLPDPEETFQRERELHNLTHLPVRR